MRFTDDQGSEEGHDPAPVDWAQRLEHGDLRSRILALMQLEQFSEIPLDAAEPLVRILQDASNQWVLRSKAAWLLAKIAPKTRFAVSALQGAVREQDPIHFDVVNLLRELGPVAESAYESLLEVFLDPSRKPMQRYGAASALGSVLREAKSKAKALVPILIARLAPEEDNAVREGAVAALGGFGSAAMDAVPYLVSGLSEPEWGERCAVALIKIGSEPSASVAADQLMARLVSADERINKSAVVSFTSFSEEEIRNLPHVISIFERAMPFLVAVADRADEEMSIFGVKLLARMGSAAISALPTLRSLLERGPSELQAAAKEALRQLESG